MSTEVLRQSAEMFVQANPDRSSIDDYAEQLITEGRMTAAVAESIAKARAKRLGHDVIFYIAGGLTGMSDEVKQRYVELSELIATHQGPDAEMFGYAPHLHGTDPIKHPAVTPAEVRDIDYLWAAVVADGQFNFWEPLAHGNAIEAGWAELHEIPAMHLVPEGMRTSRLVRGLRNVMGTIAYTDFRADGLPQVQAFLDAVQRARLKQLSEPGQS